jgi:hypothetical protein
MSLIKCDGQECPSYGRWFAARTNSSLKRASCLSEECPSLASGRLSEAYVGIEGLAQTSQPIPDHCLLSEHVSGDVCPIPMLKSFARNASSVGDIFSITNCVNRLWKKYQLTFQPRHSPCYYHLHQTQQRVEGQTGQSQRRANDSNCFTKGSSAGGVAGDDCESDPGERLHFRPTTLFSFFDSKLVQS